jgi:hypothetical protein
MEAVKECLCSYFYQPTFRERWSNKNYIKNIKKKKSISPLNYWGGLLNPSTTKRSILPLNFPKPVKLPSNGFQTVVLLQYHRCCYSTHGLATVPAILSFLFLFISAESLKNHSKSQKNHKMENLVPAVLSFLFYSFWLNL